MSETPGISDETLMAYADGELPPAEHAAVAARLEDDPDLRERLECFSFTRGPVAKVYEELLLSPLPARLLTAAGIDRPPTPRKADAASPGWLEKLLAALTAPMLSPAAAISAVVVAAAAGWLLQGALRGDDISFDAGGIVASASLQSALETTPTGEVARVGRHLRVRPKFTFANLQDNWCRQYELIVGEDMSAGGLACREDGVWKVIVQTSATHQDTPGMTVPAGQDDILEALRSAAKAGDVLGPEQERPLIRDRWPAPR